MRVNDSTTLCVVPDSTARPLGGAEATVIVVVIVTAAALSADGMPTKEVMLLLSAAGPLSVLLAQLATGAVTRGLRHLARAQSLALPQ
jgi:hypothetical protein